MVLAENPKWQKVENKDDQGSFELQIKIGDDETTSQKVQPVDGNLPQYLQDQIDGGSFIVTSRYGSRGECAIRVNTDAVEVDSMKRHGDRDGLETWTNDIMPSDFSEAIHVDFSTLNNGLVFEMLGQTKENLTIEAKIFFKPSPVDLDPDGIESDPDVQVFKAAEESGEYKDGTILVIEDGEIIATHENVLDVDRADIERGVYLGEIETEGAIIDTPFIEE